MSSTVAVIVPIMLFPVGLSVLSVAEMIAPPHPVPAGASKPVPLTTATNGVFDVHVTVDVMSFVAGGWV